MPDEDKCDFGLYSLPSRDGSARVGGRHLKSIPHAKMPGILANPGHLKFLLRDRCRCLDGGNVLRLPALGALGHVELHGLAFLQALEAASLTRGEMHENVFAILTADKTVTLGVVKPLHCSLFCH